MLSILRVFDNTGKRVDIPAIRGEAGKTPEKGVDYLTEAEKTEYMESIFASLPAAELVATLDDGSAVTYRLYGEVVSG